ncbi:L-rhamnose-binding lectin CSL3 [Mizuhopecten yessoensis]|uniref:L-rhamnose-binding lectin CSL3 n=1 Tax=Mizuhopecten yessoensis TaxID=6573 RepID=A0A210QLK4_MIZYE|nr:L-rhamnose-binding lectin CSL3 [Mizuhopecten yessoensis]
MSSLFGRTTKSVCPNRATYNVKCKAMSSMAKVSEACDGKSECILSASNTVFGDPCRGTYKYLEVEYKCIKTEVVCEGRRKTIKCDAGETIKVMSSMYGRTTKSVCPNRATYNVKCKATSSMAKVSEACDGTSECILSASNTVFGDPCRGTYKYLEVEYKCIKTAKTYI